MDRPTRLTIATRLLHEKGRTASYSGVEPWMGDSPHEMAGNALHELNKKPAFQKLRKDLKAIPGEGNRNRWYSAWEWIGAVYLVNDRLLGVPVDIAQAALDFMIALPNDADYERFKSGWREPEEWVEALAVLTADLYNSIRWPGPNGVIRLAKRLDAPRYFLASKFQNKKEVPKAKGKGTTTVYEYSDKQVQHRNREKAKRIEKLRGQMDRLRTQYKKDLKAADDSTRASALIVALMDVTYARIGNENSASAGHFGVTGWKVKHITFSGPKATIKYTGKSGVDHAKEVTDAGVVSALRAATKGKGPGDVICDAAAEDANIYLKPFGVSAKDLRGLHANQEMIDRLKAVRSKGGKLPADPDDRKKKLKAEFDDALQQSAGAVGHEPSTLRSQYLVPGLEDEFMSKGSVKTKLSYETKIVRQVRIAQLVLAKSVIALWTPRNLNATRFVMLDFDGTLFGSQDGPPIWWTEPGQYSWGNNPVSMGPPCVPQRPGSKYWNTSALAAAKAATNDSNTVVAIVTGRIAIHKNRIRELLAQQGITPDLFYMNPGGGSAATAKKVVFNRMMEYLPNLNTVEIWENENLSTYTSFVKGKAKMLGRNIKVIPHAVSMKSAPIDCSPDDFYPRSRP